MLWPRRPFAKPFGASSPIVLLALGPFTFAPIPGLLLLRVWFVWLPGRMRSYVLQGVQACAVSPKKFLAPTKPHVW